MAALTTMYGSGAAMGAVSMLLPHEPQRLQWLRWGLAGLAALLAIGVRALGDRQPPWLSHLVVAVGSVVIACAIHLAGDLPVNYLYGFFYVWVALFATFFFTLPAAALHIGLAALAHGVVLVPWSAEDHMRWLLMTGTHVSVLLVGADVERKKQRLQSLVNAVGGCITVVRSDLTISFQGGAVRALLGYGSQDLIDRPLTDLVHPDDATRLVAVLRGLSTGGPARAVECRMRTAAGEWLETETTLEDQTSDRELAGIVLVSRDITERKAFERQLAHQAFHDPLTGLANRALMTDRLSHALARGGRKNQRVGVLFMDLDDFKAVNDTLGHAAGDELLRIIAGRMVAVVRPADTVARLGGDEFAVLLDEVADDDEARQVAGRLLDALAEPLAVAGRHVRVGVSIGMALTTPDRNAGGLLRDADAAMYRAKSRGKNRVEMFEPGMHEPLLRRAALKADLPQALAREELRLSYQPTVHLATGVVTGLEALLRWHHPELGLISPAEFIPLAEETSLIVPIGRWVLEEACLQARDWVARDPKLHLHVNLSGRQLADDAIVGDVASILSGTGFPARQLTLEITETVLLHDVDETTDRLRRLRRLGVRIAIDDFGTGYSSLSSLQQLPIDVLKIDKSFVDGVAGSGERSAIVDHVVRLARTLRLHTVAEGVEAAAQADVLRDLACDEGQGFLFAKPLDPQDVDALLAQGVFSAAPGS